MKMKKPWVNVILIWKNIYSNINIIKLWMFRVTLSSLSKLKKIFKKCINEFENHINSYTDFTLIIKHITFTRFLKF